MWLSVMKKIKVADLVHDEGGDKEPYKGRGKGPFQPCDPWGGNDDPHLCSQLEAQQVLGGSSEEEGRGVHRALELGLHQELAQLACRLGTCVPTTRMKSKMRL